MNRALKLVEALLDSEDDDFSNEGGSEVDWTPDPEDPDSPSPESVKSYGVVHQRMEWVKDNLEWDESMELWCIPYTGFSDYSGGTVERSNSAVLDEKFEFVSTVHGGYGSVWTGISEENLNLGSDDDWEEFTGMVDGLEGYPLIDEEHHSNMEMELQNEAWNDWVRSDLKKEAVRKSNDPLMKFTYAKMTDAEWDAVRYELESHGDGRFEWHDEHGSMHVSVDRAYQSIDTDLLPDRTREYAAAKMAIWNGWLASFFETLLRRRKLPEVEHVLAVATSDDLYAVFTTLERPYTYELWDVDEDGDVTVDKDSVSDMAMTAEPEQFLRWRRPDTEAQIGML